MTFAAYTGSNVATLTTALLAPNSGISVSNIALNASGQNAVNFYDGSLAPLGIGAGLLLTSGTTPGIVNTMSWFGTDNSIWPTTFYNGDADIDAVVNTVFQTQSYDATTLSFDFTVADPNATSVSFDLVFGSDEFPEWVDQFVDSAIVMVNGVNYALFNHDPMHPLSVVSSNLAAGYFQDNAGNVLPIEYDGVSHVLKIVAPIIPGGATNHIKIGIADTGDHIYDSGIFIANLSAGNIPGSGVVSSTTGTGGNDTVTGSSQAEYFDLQGGDDSCYAGAGDDIVVAGSGKDSVYGGSGADQMKGDAGDDYLDGGADADTAVFSGASADYIVASVGGGFMITDNTSGAPEGTDTLTNVEFAKFSDGLFSIGVGGVLTPVANPGTPPANTPGSVVISGVGSVGNILTATVSDPDGVSGAVSYQWLADGAAISGAADSNTYTVSAADVGMNIQVIASYLDNGSQAESPVSASKTILATNNGDLNVTLMQLTAPAGTSIINPLTTLLQDAIDLGVSPNMAALAMKTALGLPAGINLQTYDAFAVLQNNPSDPTALAVEKVAVQVAILTSLSDDDTGVNLTLAILNAAAIGQTLNLADANDLANILGLDILAFDITDKTTYPQPLREIFDRNKSMSDAIADGGDVSVIEAQWHDLLTIQDGINSTSIADLSIHVNQAPTGSATASLIDGSQGMDYTISAISLLEGFSDSDGGALSVSGLSADNGTVTVNGGGTSFTITPTPNYNGPVELTYTVIDGQGGSAPATQLFVVAPPVNTSPTGTATAVLAAGTEDTAYTVSASDLLAGFSDIDAGDTLSVSGLSASDGTATDNGNGTFTVTPTPNFNGAVALTYNVVDGHGGSITAAQDYSLAAVNDAPTGTATATLAAGTEDTAYAVSASDLLAGFSDVDGDTLSVSGLSASNGVVTGDNIVGFTITPTLNYSGPVALNYSVTDGTASIAASQSYTLAALSGVTLTGNAKANILTGSAHDDTLSGLGGNDTLNGLAGNDTLLGGAGNDTYIVDSAGDVVTEAAGAGTDLVQASVSYTLSANVEKLTLTGTAAIDATGNALANKLTGNSGNNVLDGGAGSDAMAGDAGDDTYYVDANGDAVKEATNAGIDTVHSTLAAYTLGANVENLTLEGSAVNGTGNTLANTLTGNAAANVLSGLAGNDLLDGGAGNDTLVGGAGNDALRGGSGADIFRFGKTALSATTNVDTINDFTPIDDTLALENAIFKKLTATGALSAANFRASINGSAGDTNDFILYDTDSGALYYDADGSGAGTAIQFATLIGMPTVTAADFMVI